MFFEGWKKTGLLLLLTALTAVAQDPGMEISGFRVPEYDEKGVMTSQLFGDRAVMQGNGKVKITGVSMAFYKEGKTFMEVTSPYCTFNQKTSEAHSDAPVTADMEGVRIRGKGFTLRSNERKVHILDESNVIIDDVVQQDAEAQPLEKAEAGEATVITSKELFLDYSGRKVRFEKDVRVEDSRMRMDCGTMNVGFDENNEIDWIEALVNVKLFSEGREAHAGKAIYNAETHEFLLEDNPRVLEGRNTLTGDRIRFWRGTGRMVCEPSARLIFYSDDKQGLDIFGK